MLTKLYRVHSIRDDVRIVWIALDRRVPPVRYAAAIQGLSADVEATDRQREAVDELFTREEAEAWAAYLSKHYGERPAIVEEPLPLNVDIKALSYPHDGAPDLIRPVRRADYPFSFSVYGYRQLPGEQVNKDLA